MNAPDTRAWYESVTGEDGTCSYVAVGRIGKRDYTPYEGVTWIFPPTRVNPVETSRTR